ncbi:cellulase family glycosylhydrolase [Balneolaceae bacterium ANBcel3]|nr:cellulase family glycosylhydrolase [Balneolaceae bacterium ANBcel3]
MLKYSFKIALFALITAFVCTGTGCTDRAPNTEPLSSDNSTPLMYVDGRHIYTAAGERVILRGYNEMMIWSTDPGGEWVMEEMAKTGANSVRIVATVDYSAEDLDRSIQNAILNGMIPMPECHSATGDFDRLQLCVDYWLEPDILEVLFEHEEWILLNIANEAGDINVTKEEFQEGYLSAITQLREAGIRAPLVIDGADWGKEYVNLLKSWPVFNEHDPEQAIIVSAHTYWVGSEEEQKDHYRYIIDEVTTQHIPFIIGEGPTPAGYDCMDSPYQWAMDQLEEHEIGWLAWSWGLVRNGDCNDPPRFDITDGGHYGNWRTDEGYQIAVGHRASIRNTSRRPCSIPNAGKNCISPQN